MSSGPIHFGGRELWETEPTCASRAGVKTLSAFGFVEDDIESDTAVSMVDDEATYAHHAELTALAKAGVVFFGWHEAGCEYDAALLASDGSGDLREALSMPNELLALVCVKPDGTIAERDLDCVREYYAALAATRTELGIVEAKSG